MLGRAGPTPSSDAALLPPPWSRQRCSRLRRYSSQPLGARSAPGSAGRPASGPGLCPGRRPSGARARGPERSREEPRGPERSRKDQKTTTTTAASGARRSSQPADHCFRSGTRVPGGSVTSRSADLSSWGSCQRAASSTTELCRDSGVPEETRWPPTVSSWATETWVNENPHGHRFRGSAGSATQSPLPWQQPVTPAWPAG